MSEFENVICRALRGDHAGWPMAGDPETVAEFVDCAAYHGVRPLLHARLAGMPAHARAQWPSQVVKACRRAALKGAAHELAHRAELVRVLAALAAMEVAPLLLKGTALAYSHYPSPTLRPRCDTDLLIPPARRDATETTLGRLGYARVDAVAGGLVSAQATWRHVDRLGNAHHLDVHWRASNSQILARVFDYDELDARARPLPALGPHARGLAPVDALIFACMHRAGHIDAPMYVGGEPRRAGDRLIWLHDIHVVVSRLSARELAEFVAMAASKRVKSLCLDALERCTARFGTVVAPHVRQRLADPAPLEPAARYLGRGPMRQLIGDFVALERWGQRARLFRELAFPADVFMRAKYAGASVRWLPLLYARRGLAGLRKLAPRRSPREGG
jgi:hypothetical protein